MENRIRVKKWSAAVLLGIFLAGMLPLYSVQAQQADMNTMVSAAAQILYNNEGSYNSVNPNDNGAVSIGKLQWHGWRALALLQSIVSANEEQAKSLLGSTLYKEVVQTDDTTRWSTRKLTTQEAAAVRKFLATDESKAAQDTLAVKDITGYIEQGQRLGIQNAPALVYFADIANQGGAGASGRVGTSAAKAAGSYEAVTLNEMHIAAVCDSVMGAYASRRFATYKYAAGLGWAYCNAGDSYIPSDYVSSTDSGTAWVQRALNTSMNAGLDITDTYDQATKDAVIQFQAEKKLEIDGFSGRDTIIALMKAVLPVMQAQNPGTPPINPGGSTNPDTSTDNPGGSTNPGTSTDNPGSMNPGTSTDNPGGSTNPGTSTDNPGSSTNPGTSTDSPELNPPVEEPDEPQEEPLKETILKAPKKSYAVNDTHKAFMLEVTSSHTIVPIRYASSNESAVTVRRDGQVKIVGAGTAQITASQEEGGGYKGAQLQISITVYSTDPSDYAVPSGALYAEKNMKKSHVHWLQAALIQLDGADITVNGTWSGTMTRLVTDFQKKCKIGADGIAGDQTKDIIKNMLAVQAKKPQASAAKSGSTKTVSWKKYTKANRVYIYRREKGGSFKRIKTITNMKKTSYQDKTAKKGTSYTYAVRYGYVQGKITVKGPASQNL